MGLWGICCNRSVGARVDNCGMSCPSWQRHRTGYGWLPVRTLPVAPLWCDLGFCSQIVAVLKLQWTPTFRRIVWLLETQTANGASIGLWGYLQPWDYGGLFQNEKNWKFVMAKLHLRHLLQHQPDGRRLLSFRAAWASGELEWVLKTSSTLEPSMRSLALVNTCPPTISKVFDMSSRHKS